MWGCPCPADRKKRGCLSLCGVTSANGGGEQNLPGQSREEQEVAGSGGGGTPCERCLVQGYFSQKGYGSQIKWIGRGFRRTHPLKKLEKWGFGAPNIWCRWEPIPPPFSSLIHPHMTGPRNRLAGTRLGCKSAESSSSK